MRLDPPRLRRVSGETFASRAAIAVLSGRESTTTRPRSFAQHGLRNCVNWAGRLTFIEYPTEIEYPTTEVQTTFPIPLVGESVRRTREYQPMMPACLPETRLFVPQGLPNCPAQRAIHSPGFVRAQGSLPHVLRSPAFQPQTIRAQLNRSTRAPGWAV